MQAIVNREISMTVSQLRCASWNIHRARGQDGRIDPDRIRTAVADHLRPRALDVLALQEADDECPPHGRILDVAGIAADTGLVYQHDDEAMRWRAGSDGFLGTILFLHARFTVCHRAVLDLPGHCHRGAVILEISGVNDENKGSAPPFRIISTHLSLSQPLRIVQMRIIGQYIFRRPEMQTVFLGDFNEWRPWGGLMFNRHLVGRRFSGPVRRTFPSGRPLLPLDRIMTDEAGAVKDVEVLDAPDLRLASDHLPITGLITLSRGR